jgi:hypothetical protein
LKRINLSSRIYYLSVQDLIFTLEADQKHTGIYGKWMSQSGITPEMFIGKDADEFTWKQTKKHNKMHFTTPRIRKKSSPKT